MMPVTRQPTPLLSADHRHVALRFQRVINRHIHLDWRTFEQWMREPNFFARVIRVNDSVQALVGATVHQHPHPQQEGSPAAWLRFILPPKNMDETALEALWCTLLEELAAEGVKQVACLSLQHWVRPFIVSWGFEKINAIVTMRRTKGKERPTTDDMYIRPGALSDIPAVVDVDAAAFGPLWAYNEPTLRLAQREAVYFSVIEQAGQIVAYQISTNHYGSGHLARLAVRPGLQGQGYGSALVSDMLHHFDQQGVRVISVNTQKDNLRSRRLYNRFGFEHTGQDVPVYLFTM